MELRELIPLLTGAKGPAGFEKSAVDVAAELLRPWVDELRRDTLGSLIALRRCKREDAPTVMLEAHIDEIGLLVRGYAGGALRFQALGGVDERILPALEVTVLTDPPIRGVIDVPPDVGQEGQRCGIEQLVIDVGMGEEEVKKRVPVGTPVCFSTECMALGENRLCGKSMDDRSCVAILIRVMELLRGEELPCHVAVVFSVQEEVGGRGAMAASYALAPEAALAMDVTFGTSPDSPAPRAFPLHHGPTIGVGPNMHRAMTDALIALAEREGIPYLIEPLPGHSGTDAWPIQVSREGIATALLSLPLRYMHTPVEVMDLRDGESCVELIAAWVKNYGREVE